MPLFKNSAEDILRTVPMSSSQSQFASVPSQVTSSQIPALDPNWSSTSTMHERERTLRLQQSIEELLQQQRETNQLLSTIVNTMQTALVSLPSNPVVSPHVNRSSSVVISRVKNDDDLDEFDLYATVVSAEELFERAREKKRLRKKMKEIA